MLAAQEQQNPHGSAYTHGDSGGGGDDDTNTVCGVSAAEAATATKVLIALAAEPEAFRGKEFKALRAALHTLRQSEGASMVLGFGMREVALVQVVSDALRDCRWSDALGALQKMRQRKQVQKPSASARSVPLALCFPLLPLLPLLRCAPLSTRVPQMPKLGSVQRWVRECDAAGDYDSEAMLVLDAVLRTADPGQVGAMQSEAARQALVLPDGSCAVSELKSGGRVRWYPPWEGAGLAAEAPGPHEFGATMRHAQSRSAESKALTRSLFSACWFEEGAQRKPPNLHPLTIHTSVPGAIRLDPAHAPPRCIPVPFVPGAFLIADLFTHEECKAMIEAGEAIGYDPDAPAGGTSAAEKKSILAHAFVWCTDAEFIEQVWRRLSPLMPILSGGHRPLGLNRRWRCYRYVPGAVYRPHVDGAWPSSGVDGDGKYVYDAFDDGRASRLTFLIYLNDDFQGGCTTFFTPSALEPGVLDARGLLSLSLSASLSVSLCLSLVPPERSV
jgi:hypothetical protein